jgi:hypothetical protein
MELDHKNLELGMKDIEMDSLKKKIEWLLLKLQKLSGSNLGSHGNKTEHQKTKLQEQEAFILELENANHTLNQRLKIFEEKFQEDYHTMELQQKALREMETKVKIKENLITELQHEIANLKEKLNYAESDQIENVAEQKFIEKENTHLERIELQISGSSFENNNNNNNKNNNKVHKSNQIEEIQQFEAVYIDCRSEIKMENKCNQNNNKEMENKFNQYTNVPQTSSTQLDQTSNAENIEETIPNYNQIRRPQPSNCQICFSGFPHIADLRRHAETVHQITKPFKCEICSKGFGYPHHLKSHVDSIHKNLRPFKCTMCSKSFSRNTHYKHHVDSVHKNIRPFGCKICSKSFFRNSELNRHMKGVHK